MRTRSSCAPVAASNSSLTSISATLIALLVAITVTFCPGNGHLPGTHGGSTRGTGTSFGWTTVTVVLSGRGGALVSGSALNAAGTQAIINAKHAQTPLPCNIFDSLMTTRRHKNYALAVIRTGLLNASDN